MEVTEIGIDYGELRCRKSFEEKAYKENLIEIDAIKYLHKQLAAMVTKLEKKHLDIVQEQKAKELELVHEYKNEYEAQEAYGYGIISEDEYYTIRDILDRGEAAENQYTKELLAAYRLKDFLRRLDSMRLSLEYECMSSEEKTAYNKRIAKIDQRRKKTHASAKKIKSGG